MEILNTVSQEAIYIKNTFTNAHEIIDKYARLHELIVDYTIKNKAYIDAHGFPTNIIDINFHIAYNSLLDITDFLADNNVLLYNIRHLTGFKILDDIFTHWKRIARDPYFILHIRKCINWIRRTY
jgi:hypothetical protein